MYGEGNINIDCGCLGTVCWREYLDLIEIVTEVWRKLHNWELHNLYSSASIIRMIKSRRMRWAGQVAIVMREEECV
jgi:hypothetical protein